jgi:tRNA dimethylallyltransferase
MKKLLVITGPTATGKTALGLEMAEKFNGEILSADSRQVYKYMDIGTGKALDHFEWGINLVEPDKQFSVSDWVNYANKVLKDIWNRGKLPIIVGGTGQYIKELLRPSETLHIPPNEQLRNKLLSYSVIKLQKELQRVDKNKWELMNNSDRNNPRRLVRAIEIAKVDLHGLVTDSTNPDYLVIGLTAPLEFLQGRIKKRVDDRLAAGMGKERELLKKYSLPRTLGYNNETAKEWEIAEFAYAKRQLDYMEKFLPETYWFDINQDNWKDKLWLTIKSTLNI